MLAAEAVIMLTVASYCVQPAVPQCAGAYTNLVKLQMQQQSSEVARHAEVEEVLASDGKPVTRDNIDHVVSRQVAVAAWLVVVRPCFCLLIN